MTVRIIKFDTFFILENYDKEVEEMMELFIDKHNLNWYIDNKYLDNVVFILMSMEKDYEFF
jgi:hypothetical protein